MALDTKLELLRARAARALGDHQVVDAMAKVRAIIGPANIPDSEPLAQAALDKLHNGEIPTAQELTALEVVVRLLRPVVLSRRAAGRSARSPGTQPAPAGIQGSVERLPCQRGAAALLDRPRRTGDWRSRRHRISRRGWLDRHQPPCAGGADPRFRGLSPGTARIVFKQETGATNPPEHIVALDEVAAIHPKLDMVLLTLKKLGRPILQVEDTLLATVRAWR